ncbi:TetR/AcrR family transcriptional regulator [Congregibacter sp.]|uniref:TetR/AcrR family transcriptional regulator n=1 Tax=Congregibacter sp. TaxID=2744308 RepID=UPI00385B7121
METSKNADVSVRYKKSEDMRVRLLDTAERLFAARGYFGVSVRDITDAAGVRSASINYHFKSKENLFKAVFDRRIEPLASARLAKLDAIEISSKDPEKSVRLIADAFAGPMLDFAESGGDGWKNYCILVAQLAVQQHWGENTVSQKYDVHAQRFLRALQDTFPSCAPYGIHCSFQFLLSTLLYAVCDNKRMDTLSGGEYKSDALKMLRGPFLDFVSGGILSVAQAHKR